MLAESYSSCQHLQNESFRLRPINLFDLKLRSKLLHKLISSVKVSAIYSFEFRFANASSDLQITTATLTVDGFEHECEPRCSELLTFKVEAEILPQSICTFKAAFKFDPKYEVIDYSWPVSVCCNLNGVFVYTSKKFNIREPTFNFIRY